MKMRVGILTLSDKGSRGEREDASGAAIREIVDEMGAEVVRYEVLPDERGVIVDTLRAWCDEGGIDVLVTTGGTGLARRDITPEATLEVADLVVPGMAEAMRAEGMRHTDLAMLSRGAVVVRRNTLIVNLPGSERAVRQNLRAITNALPHAVALLRGQTEHEQADRST